MKYIIQISSLVEDPTSERYVHSNFKGTVLRTTSFIHGACSYSDPDIFNLIVADLPPTETAIRLNRFDEYDAENCLEELIGL